MLESFLFLASGWFVAAVSFTVTNAQIAADEVMVKSAGLKADNAALLAFFDKRTLHEGEREAVHKLIRRLGSETYRVREQALADLIARGPVVLDMLRAAVHDNDLEIVRRVEKCIARIQEKDVDADVPPAAVRLLAARRATGAVETMLAYMPFADTPEVAEEARKLLAAMAMNKGRASATLIAALTDPVPARRAAAGEALGRADVAAQRPAVRKLLADPEPYVRLRVAMALVNAQDKNAVATLIDALPALTLQQAWQAEELLFHIADGDAPPVTTIGIDEVSKVKARDAWQAWWANHAAQADLARLHEKPPMLGYTLLILLDIGRVMEITADKGIRWQVDDLVFPLDVQTVSGNRFLVAEYGAGRVTERNLRGDILWRKDITGPLVAQRLGNGNTFIATVNQVQEVDRAGNTIFNFNMADDERIMKAMKLRNGEIACLTDGVRVVRFDVTGREIYSYPVVLVGTRLSGGRIYMLDNGHVLIPHNSENKVVEYDARGKAVWEVAVDQPVAAVRLPNGHTLITTMFPQRGVVEFDHEGKEVWNFHETARLGNSRITRALRR